MTIMELKEAVIHDAASEDFMIFKYAGDRFLAMQYVHEIAKVRGCPIRIIENLADSRLSGSLALVFESVEELKVLIIDTFCEDLTDYYEYENTIVVCNKIDKKIANKVAEYVIDFPAVQDWQVEAYLNTLGLAISEKDLKELYELNKRDLFATTNELDKIALFPTEEQANIFATIKNDIGKSYEDQYVFTISDAITNLDLDILYDYLVYQNTSDLDPMKLTSTLLAKCKNMLLYMNGVTDAAALGISNSYYIKQAVLQHPIAANKLQDIIRFLSNIDLRLKQNKLDMTKEQQMTYIICNAISLLS